MCPPTTDRSHWPTFGIESCMRRLSSAFTAPNFACSLLRIVCRRTVKRPLLLFFPQICVNPRKLNVSGFPSPRFFRFSAANGPNSKPRFLGMQFQAELSHSLNQFCPEPYGIRFRLEAHDDIVRKPHDDHVTAGVLSTPRLGPQVEPVVKIDIGQQRRCTAALGRPFFRPGSFPLPPTRRHSAIFG